MLQMVKTELLSSDPDVPSPNEAHVSELAKSIAEVGLLNPITVQKGAVPWQGIFRDGYRVVAGHHRLAACRRLSLVEVEVNVVDLSGPRRALAEADENLCRRDLTPTERSRLLLMRKNAYIALHPETQHGGDRGNQHTGGKPSRQVGDLADTPSFAEDTAAKTGLGERTVQRDTARAEAIGDEVMAEIERTDLDKGVVLDKLAAAPDPKAALEAIRKEKDKEEARRRNGQADREISAVSSDEFAEWLFERTDKRSRPTIMTWLESAKPKLIAAAMRRLSVL